MHSLAKILALYILIAAPLESGRACARAEEIDRLLAAVNGRVITYGDLRLARNLNLLFSLGKHSAGASEVEELNRLVDLELLRQELKSFAAIRAEGSDIESKMSELRSAYAEIGGLPALLRRLDLQESELRDYVALQVSILKFIDFRFRPFVTVSPAETRSYYQEKLLPQLQKSAASRLPGWEEVSAGIEEIITQEKVTASLDRWIQEIRRHSRIELITGSRMPAVGTKQ